MRPGSHERCISEAHGFHNLALKNGQWLCDCQIWVRFVSSNLGQLCGRVTTTGGVGCGTIGGGHHRSARREAARHSVQSLCTREKHTCMMMTTIPILLQRTSEQSDANKPYNNTKSLERYQNTLYQRRTKVYPTIAMRSTANLSRERGV